MDPVTFVWLLLLAVTGIVNITKFPGIFRAFDPSRAVLCMLYISSPVYCVERLSSFCAHKEIR